MKQINLFKVNLKRALFSWRFVLSSIGVCLMMLSAVLGFISGPNSDATNSVYYLMGLSISGSGIASMALCILPVFAFAISFAIEWEEKALSFWVVRTGVVPYAISKVLVSAISGFCTITVGIALFIFILQFKFPLFTHPNTDFSYETLMEQGHWFEGFLLYILHYALSGALIGVCAMWISTYIPNRFVAAAGPVVLHFTLLRITGGLNLPAWLNPIFWVEAIYNTSSPVTTILLKLVTVLILCSILGILSVRQMKRRILNA